MRTNIKRRRIYVGEFYFINLFLITGIRGKKETEKGDLGRQGVVGKIVVVT